MYVPPEWHAAAAHIVPVRKKGITGDFSNYRPISLTCVTSKILERIIVNRIFDHLAHNSILHPSQHGFVKQRSTCTNHLESFNDWTLNEATHFTVYVDFIILVKPLTLFRIINCLQDCTHMAYVAVAIIVKIIMLLLCILWTYASDKSWSYFV